MVDPDDGRPATIPPARVVEANLATQIGIVVAIVALTTGAIIGLSLLELESRVLGWTLKGLAGAAGLTVAFLQPYVRRWFAAISIDQWRAIDAETVRDPKHNPHVITLVVLLTCALSLTIQEYVGGADKYEIWFPYDGGEYWELSGFVWWTVWRVIGYVLIPAAVILCLPGQRLRDCHVSPRGFFRHLWIYALMFVAFSPIVIVASMSSSFRETYPFYRMANRSHVDLCTSICGPGKRSTSSSSSRSSFSFAASCCRRCGVPSAPTRSS
jgi:hypothetical protein